MQAGKTKELSMQKKDKATIKFELPRDRLDVLLGIAKDRSVDLAEVLKHAFAVEEKIHEIKKDPSARLLVERTDGVYELDFDYPK
jgi:hypothetical protein